MPENILEEAKYLREKAENFRKIADQYQTQISPFLREMAKEFDQRAEQLEKRGQP